MIMALYGRRISCRLANTSVITNNNIKKITIMYLSRDNRKLSIELFENWGKQIIEQC